jgi:hypothetical protein
MLLRLLYLIFDFFEKVFQLVNLLNGLQFAKAFFFSHSQLRTLIVNAQAFFNPLPRPLLSTSQSLGIATSSCLFDLLTYSYPRRSTTPPEVTRQLQRRF